MEVVVPSHWWWRAAEPSQLPSLPAANQEEIELTWGLWNWRLRKDYCFFRRINVMGTHYRQAEAQLLSTRLLQRLNKALDAAFRDVFSWPIRDMAFSVITQPKGCIDMNIGAHATHAPKFSPCQKPIFLLCIRPELSRIKDIILPFGRGTFGMVFDFDFRRVMRRMFLREAVDFSVSHEDHDDGAADTNKDEIKCRTAGAETWLVATAAPHHATGNRALLSGFTTHTPDDNGDDLFLRLQSGDGRPMIVRGRGAVVTGAVTLQDVWYVPGLAANLVSVGQLAELGYTVGFARGVCRVVGADGDVEAGVGRLGEDGLFALEFLNLPLC